MHWVVFFLPSFSPVGHYRLEKKVRAKNILKKKQGGCYERALNVLEAQVLLSKQALWSL